MGDGRCATTEGVSRKTSGTPINYVVDYVTVEKRAVDPDPIGALGPVKLRELEAAIRYALTLRDP